eukprot:TRINITY_DN4889_c0_g1_i3.p1 TRINITY_DN4889_c0_g1~~TRINITY_DN4889_c0_g1_i3.p1  ORF type:complete len:336 (+),score=67.63 TRINITY_DN4889_c0_g1_i3:1012-2019(+)
MASLVALSMPRLTNDVRAPDLSEVMSGKKISFGRKSRFGESVHEDMIRFWVEHSRPSAHRTVTRTRRSDEPAVPVHYTVRSSDEMFYLWQCRAVGSSEDHSSVKVMDFSPWKRRFDREVSMSDWFDVLQALHICVITRDANGELCYEYFDYFSEASNNYQFVMKAMKEFFATETMTAFKSSEINLWSDGGPHHFKINTSIYFMLIDVLYDFGIRVTWKFFASNHGKGACDVHTGTCKRAARKYALTHILDGTGDIANFVNEYVKNAQAWSLSKGDVTKEKLNIARRLESVKKWHFFGLEDAVGHGKCYRIRTRQTDEPEADEMIQTITAGDEASD